ncbi:MAG: ABC transporter permease, partial [Pseudomonadota bacterium]
LAGQSTLTHYTLKLIAQGLIITAHNAAIVVLIALWLGQAPHWHIVFLVPILALLTVFLFASATLIALVGSRYRDVPEIISAILRVSFFVTPIFWSVTSNARAEQLGPILYLNPFYYVVQSLRPPLIGQPLQFEVVAILGLMTVIVTAVLFAAYRRFAPTTPMWL